MCPSITICPQGGANDIVDAAIFKQFLDYLEDKNLSYDDLSDSQVRDETYNFLNEDATYNLFSMEMLHITFICDHATYNSDR